jgi:hypothetical protein
MRRASQMLNEDGRGARGVERSFAGWLRFTLGGADGGGERSFPGWFGSGDGGGRRGFEWQAAVYLRASKLAVMLGGGRGRKGA